MYKLKFQEIIIKSFGTKRFKTPKRYKNDVTNIRFLVHWIQLI